MPKHIRGVPSRFVQAVRDLDDVYFLREEVGQMLGVSPSTLKAWGQRDPELAPYGYLETGGRIVYLYRPEDVAELRAHQLRRYPILANGARARRRGRPKLWSREEMEDRDSRHRRVAYLKKKAEAAAERGAEHQQLALLAEVAILREGLTSQYAERFAEVTRPQTRPADWLATHMQPDSVS